MAPRDNHLKGNGGCSLLFFFSPSSQWPRVHFVSAHHDAHDSTMLELVERLGRDLRSQIPGDAVSERVVHVKCSCGSPHCQYCQGEPPRNSGKAGPLPTRHMIVHRSAQGGDTVRNHGRGFRKPRLCLARLDRLPHLGCVQDILGTLPPQKGGRHDDANACEMTANMSHVRWNGTGWMGQAFDRCRRVPAVIGSPQSLGGVVISSLVITVCSGIAWADVGVSGAYFWVFNMDNVSRSDRMSLVCITPEGIA